MAFKYLLKEARKMYNSQHSASFLRIFCTSPYHSQVNWTQAVSNAEKVVGYPTSFLSLRCLMSEEISNMAFYLKKLIGTGHPLLSTAKKLVYANDKIHQTRGLLVLLISKATNGNNPDITPEQRSLAEITELIHTAHLIHSGVISIEAVDKNLELGNKMAILCGDFLLAHSCVALAALHNAKVVELISQAISDISTSEFIDVFMAEGDPIEKWNSQAKLRYGTLLANACQSSLILGNNSDLLEQCHSFGFHIALAWQANIELESLKKACSKERNKHSLSLLFPAGTAYPTIVSKVENERNVHIDAATSVLKDFPSNEATSALYNIVKALRC